MQGISAWLILGIIGSLFFAMYLYAISSNLIDDARETRLRKKKKIREEQIRQERIRKSEIRAEKLRLIERRRNEIKKEFKWLKEINKKIEEKTGDTL